MAGGFCLEVVDESLYSAKIIIIIIIIIIITITIYIYIYIYESVGASCLEGVWTGLMAQLPNSRMLTDPRMVN